MTKKIDVTAPGKDRRIELYISPSCPYCVQAMEHYDGMGLAYAVRDAQNDPVARREMFAFTHGDPTVPAIVVDGAYAQSGWGEPPRG